MRSLKFHYVRAENVLCFGPEGIELHFSDYGQVVQVVGINYDNPGTEEDPASNASGKSSISELLSIGLYGRTVKSPTKNKGSQIINCLANKGSIEVQWDDFRVLRTFTKSKSGSIKGTLQLWKSADRIWDEKSEITQTIELIQNEIEKNIGLTHHAFCNVVIFDDSNTYSFLEADGPTKRNIVENLLDLDQYRGYHENCKNILKDLKRKIEILTKDYANLQDVIDASLLRIATIKSQEESWKVNKKKDLMILEDRLKQTQKELESSDIGEQLIKWQKAQDKAVVLTNDIVELEDKRQRVEIAIKQAKEKADQFRTDRAKLKEIKSERAGDMTRAEADLERAVKLISKLEGLQDGAICPYCNGVVNRLNHGHVIEQAQEDSENLQKIISIEKDKIADYSAEIEKKSSGITLIEEKVRAAEMKVSEFEGKVRKNRAEISQLMAVPKPEGNNVEQLLETRIFEIKKQLNVKKEECEGESPYKEIIAQSEIEKSRKEVERDEKAKELQEAEAEVPYYQFWFEAFGDNGIRKFVIDGIIPALNSRVSYWLQILIDGKIELSFDNKLEEVITRSGNPATYHNTSNGERRRINLAVSQAFAYVMMLNSGTCPSIVFLDEITGGGIDRAGIPGVYNMIFELAKERQVFVTSHNETLVGLLQGCENLTLKKRNDITILAS